MMRFIQNLELCQREGWQEYLSTSEEDGWKTNYGNILVVGNIHESWWSLDYGREDTQITTSCSGRTLLSREKRHDYFKHSLPSGLEKREKSHRHHHSGCLLNFRIPDKFLKHTKLSPPWIRYGYLLPVTLLSGLWHCLISNFPLAVTRLRWPRGILVTTCAGPSCPLTIMR